MLPPLMSDERAKQLAARAALALLPDAGVIGLGSGSTARYFIEGVAELVRAGKHYEGVPTSHESRALATRLGIPLLDDDGPWDVLVCVDGADEVSDELDLIKGGGGAHTREKIVNFAARKNVIVVDDSKLSRTLGERRAVPVEVLPFAHRETHFLLSLHGEPTLRLAGGGSGVPFRTDSGNYVYDLRTGAIRRPAELDADLRTIPGVVETGLFCGRVDVLFVTRDTEVQRIDKPA
jgi:ribose 5-phosphate isomerase A